MSANAFSIALSGISAAHSRVQAAAHNVANLQTEGFRPLKVHQISLLEGGVRPVVTQAEEPEPVSIAAEFVGSRLAVIQARSSAVVVEIETELLGSLLDLHA